MSETILGVHSSVRPGVIGPATGRPMDPGLIDGHAWLTVTRDGVSTTYGLWPDDHPRVVHRGLNNGVGSDIRRGFEDDMTPAASRYYRLTPKQTATLESKLKENVHWGVTDNCSSWASSTLEAVTGQRLNADEPYTAGVVETPRVLGGSIQALERMDHTSRIASGMSGCWPSNMDCPGTRAWTTQSPPLPGRRERKASPRSTSSR
ncbi:hypothetical protein [Hydrogenophaga sp.]|uniref:hypothetical protein n=1 Tax=Hydrogenophaga sp. TaxID=1904254 RepID=UPI0035AF6E3E